MWWVGLETAESECDYILGQDTLESVTGNTNLLDLFICLSSSAAK